MKQNKKIDVTRPFKQYLVFANKSPSLSKNIYA